MAEKILQSRMPMDCFLKDPDGYNRFHAGGCSKITSERNVRAIVRTAKEVTLLFCFQNQGISRNKNLDINRKKCDSLSWFIPEEAARASEIAPLRIKLLDWSLLGGIRCQMWMDRGSVLWWGSLIAPTVISIIRNINAHKYLFIPSDRTAEEVLWCGEQYLTMENCFLSS